MSNYENSTDALSDSAGRAGPDLPYVRDVPIGSIVPSLCVIFIRFHVPIVAVIPSFMMGYGPIPSESDGRAVGPRVGRPPSRSATEADPAALRRPGPRGPRGPGVNPGEMHR